jgi:tRNA U38,U39,U40 pseudouridine synthase TruA
MPSTAGMTAGTGTTDSGVTAMTGVATTNAMSALMIDAVQMIEEVLTSTVVWTTEEARMNTEVLTGFAIMTGGM